MTGAYPDWLNPMLVKELRQGLNKGVFIGVFLLVQAAMIILVGMRLIAAEGEMEEGLGGYMDGILRGGLGTIVLFILPLRGLASIQEEKKLQTLELVQMTPLGSHRIVWGKWLAVMSQVMLFTVAVLPYGVLRYFFGGMDILESSYGLAYMLLGSMVITAMCVWLSAMGAAIRVLAILFIVFAGQGLSMLSMGIAMAGGPSRFGFAYNAPVIVFGAVVTTLFLLAMAASRIGSAAENHAAVLRSIALVAGLGSVAGTLATGPAWAHIGTPVMVWAMFLALTELTSEVPSMYAPWMRWGLPGRMACRVLNPGWATGLFFSLIIIALLAILSYWTTSGPDKSLPRTLLLFGLYYLAMVFPLLLVVPFLGAKFRGMVYLLVQALCCLLLPVGAAMGATAKHAVYLEDLLNSLTPTSAAVWAMTHIAEAAHWATLTRLAVPVGLVVLVFLLYRSIREFRLMARQEAKVTAAKAMS